MLPTDYNEHDDFISALSRPVLPVVQCHACGYEPPRPDHPPRQCPKCLGGAWERFIWRGRLDDAIPQDRRAESLHVLTMRSRF